jgi:hypothetical protein
MDYLDFDPTVKKGAATQPTAGSNATQDFLAYDPTTIQSGGGARTPQVGESKQMGLLDYAKLGLVDNPDGRLNVIAQAMGVDPKYIGREGDRMMYYDPQTGQRHDITTEGFGPKAMEFAGSMIGKAPTIIGSMAGAAAGVPLGPAGVMVGGIAGSAIGEGARQFLGSTLEEKTLPGVAGQIGLEAATELIPGGIAAIGMKGARSRLAHELQNGGAIDAGRVSRLQGLENQFNIPLTAAERTGLPSMLIEQKRLLNKPGASDVLRPWLDERGGKVFNAIESFASDFSNVDSVYNANKMVKDAVSDTVTGLKRARTEAANPLYKQAFDEGGDIDVSGVVGMIERDLPKLAGKQEQKAKDVLSMLTGKMRRTTGADGKEVVEPFIPLEVVNNIKLELDDMIAGAQAGGNTNLVAKLTATKNQLINTADAASDTYKQAREAWKGYVDPKSGVKVSDVSEGLIGEVGNKQRWERQSDAINTIFGAGSSPEIIAKARLTVGAENPDAWNAMLKGYLLDNLRSIKAVSGEAVNPNIGGLYFKRTLGDPHQAAMLKAAMTPEQFEKFNAIGELLHLSSKAGGKESATHYLSAADEKARRMAPKGGVVGAAKLAETVNPLSWENKARGFISGLEDDAVERFERALAEAMIRPDGLNKIRYLQVLTPDQQRFRAATTMFVDDMLGSAASTATSDPKSMGIPLRDPAQWMDYDQNRK